jgi:polysaccharide export outer membrane protein
LATSLGRVWSGTPSPAECVVPQVCLTRRNMYNQNTFASSKALSSTNMNFPLSAPAKLLLALALASACASYGFSQTSPAPNPPAPAAAAAPKTVDVPAQIMGGAPVDNRKYKVGPEDVLNVNVWEEPKFTGLYTVHSDGKITMPLVGDIDAGGLAPVEIEPLVVHALSKLIVKPLVTVTVQAVYSRKYYMDGEINKPGEYPLQTRTTILDAISKAGGLAGFANAKKIYILRGDKRIPFNYKDVIHGKNPDQNIALEAGDHIVVP